MTESKKMLQIVWEALDEKFGRDIVAIDIEKLTTIADYMVITHGDNTSQVEALVDNVQEKMHKAGYTARSVEGVRGGRWVLLDYSDVIVNIFIRDDRSWYELERIWRDGEFVDPASFVEE